MPTQRQIDANRRNSQKSTGPRTASGKIASSRNAFKTGLYATAEVAGDENARDLQALADEYHQRYTPDTPEQRFLVDVLVHSEWLLRRLRRVEAGLWANLIESSSNSYNNHKEKFSRALRYDDKKLFITIQRRIDSTTRHYHRALNELERFQSLRTPVEPAPQPVPKPEPASEPAAAIGFVPSNLPQAQPDPAPAAQMRGYAPLLSQSHPKPGTSPLCYTGNSSPETKQIA